RIWIAWHTPAASDLKRAAVQNLLNAYLFGPTSPLYQSLVLGRQLVDTIFPTYGDHRDPNLFGVLMRVKDAKNLRTVETAVLREIKNLAGGRVDAKRLDAVRSNLRYSNIMGLDKADAAADAGVGSPGSEPHKPAAASAGSRSATPAAAQGEQRASVPPDVKRFSSGLSLLELPANQNAIVNVQLRFRAGSVVDPRGKAGLTYLTARVMTEGGTQALSAKQLPAALLPLAAEPAVRGDE